ncbi:glycosyltransferase family 9 protein [Paenarthrobacter sp. NPDC089322]|uniref:glycosyltransferase family 9 protein n=1 Tax=Paenarthrobacter sp. NPDC089322 TaxID=3155065 RepID=UPI0034476F54
MDTVKSNGHPVLLALRALKLGDLLVAVPALRGLRRAFPEHRILYAAPGWIAEALELVGGIDHLPTPGLDDPLTIAPGVVDVAVNLHGNGPESRQRIDELNAGRVLAHSSPELDGLPALEGPEWTTGLHERERWTRLLNWHGIDADPLDFRLHRPSVPSPRPGATVIHVGAAYGSRLWPVERFADVASELAAAGHDVVFTGGTSERGRAEETAALARLKGANLDDGVLAGRQGLAEFAATIAEARLVVSADTGAAHLASAYVRPSVVLFGPAPAEEWGPPPGPHKVLTAVELRRGDVFAADPDPALLAVGVRDVLDAVDELGC